MNATKFVVFLLIGIVCVNVVGARKLEGDETKETKVSVSIPKTATTKGLGAELASVDIYTSSYGSGNSDSSATAGPEGSNSDSSAAGYGSAYGGVSANAPNSASASSGTGAYGVGSTYATAGPSGATSSGYGYGDGYNYADGTAGR